jgi:PilZ domain
MEKRRFSRIAFEADAHLLVAQERIAVQLQDVSLKGALVDLKDEEASISVEAERGTLEITLDNGVVILMDVKIVHGTSRRLGLECVQIDIDSIAHLRRLVELNLADESLLYRELKALVKNNE